VSDRVRPARVVRCAPRGAALLEVIVALTILAVAGTAAAEHARACADAVARARRADDETRRASALLDAVALWPREDLDRRLGARPQGPWTMVVERESSTLYVVTLADSARVASDGAALSGRTLLRTALYRALPFRPTDAP
jgi:type II secretory pathway pseudopilin PulG